MKNNQAQATTAEVVEGRERAKGNSGQQNRVRTQCWAALSRALDRVRQAARDSAINWVLDADSRGLYDAIDHAWLVQCVAHRSGDQRGVRHIRKGLKAGVQEDGPWRQQEEGTPQGGSARPLLVNLSLPYVCDLWAAQWRRRHARGDVIIVRYCDGTPVQA